MRQNNNHSPIKRVQAKGAGKRLLAALLMLCLALTMPCMSTQAENALSESSSEGSVLTGSEDGTATVSVLHESDAGTEKDSISGNAVTDGNSDTEPGGTEPEAETGEGTPANPIHYHNSEEGGSDTTTWSYVYFGAYPQSEITDEETKLAIDSAITEGNGKPAGMEGNSEGTDVWLDDTRYRRISKEDCSDASYFDNVENTGYRYFKWERIRWRVLKNDGTTLFVAADIAVDGKDYNDTRTNITWENCTLRDWLNVGFYRNAFSSAEQGAIVAQNVKNENNPIHDTEGGNETADKVYLLSIGEVTDADYGFCGENSLASNSRRLKTSDYANARGVERLDSALYPEYKDNCSWLLRSPGNSSERAAYVDAGGFIQQNLGSYVDSCKGIVPVLHISLSSGLWSMEDDGTSGGGGNTGDSGIPVNPTHNHTGESDGTDTTTWSYIYFGAYPQSEVTDEETKSAIDAAIKAGKGQPAGTEGSSEGTDVWLDNTRYRRISKEDCNNKSNFDEGNSSYRYFKWERIKWRVLNNDGAALFVAADMALDCKSYNDTKTNITWENCTLRKWLNENFYQNAFSGAEQKAIVEQNVINEDNSAYNTEGGNDTTDKVYLLSIGEVTDENYGFCSDYSVYSDSRRLKTSDYTNARGAWKSTETSYEGNCFWWLRSPGGDSRNAAYVDCYGNVDRNAYPVDGSTDGVVPVLHIKLSSSLWSMEDDGTSGEGGIPVNPTHYHTGKNDGTDTTAWSYVYFGAYPQSEVTDAETKSAIDAAITAGKGKPAGTEENSEGTDVWLDSTRYRRISKEDCNNENNFGEENNSCRYFKWERIKWRVLKNDGSTLFVAADTALDCKDYNDTYTGITWENCTLRKWLNEDFYQNAFSNAEQGAIVEQTVVNEDDTDYGTEDGNNPTDKIHLLSSGEVTNRTLGFCDDDSVYSDSRRLKTSDYANARGAGRNTESACEGNCCWWLRSPGINSVYAAFVETDGCVKRDGDSVNNATEGVVPALHINLSSNLWFMVDDGTSGGGGNTDDSGNGKDDSGNGTDDGGNGKDDSGNGTDDGGNGKDDNGNGTDDGGNGKDDNGNGTDDSGKTDSGTDNSGNTQKNKVKVSEISLIGISKKIAAGRKIKLTAKILPEHATDKTLVWTSSNSRYATVDAQGNVTTKKAGAGKRVTITAAAKDGSGVQAKYQIKLMKHAVKKVKIKTTKKTVKAGKKLKLKAVVTATGKNANKKLKWTSSNEKYATVSASGVVKASKAGKRKEVTITATATDGTGKKAKIKIKIQ